MPDGGQLSLETKRIAVDSQFKKKQPVAKSGIYLMLAIRDTGAGIDKETLSHIFEPFFTTKQEGEGTGLGLAMVYGIVNQSDGFLTVDSEPGHGSCFRIYLPIVPGKPKGKPRQVPVAEKLHGNETILLVEDEDDVLLIG